ETVAHATAALHYVPDADVICDVGGTDVKIMILRQGTVADFRLNSQCSPVNVWIYAGQLQNLRAVGRKFVLQGGTHRNQAVVKAQLDFITGKVPDADVVVHPYSGEAGAIGAALCAVDWKTRGQRSTFR